MHPPDEEWQSDPGKSPEYDHSPVTHRIVADWLVADDLLDQRPPAEQGDPANGCDQPALIQSLRFPKSVPSTTLPESGEGVDPVIVAKLGFDEFRGFLELVRLERTIGQAIMLAEPGDEMIDNLGPGQIRFAVKGVPTRLSADRIPLSLSFS